MRRRLCRRRGDTYDTHGKALYVIELRCIETILQFIFIYTSLRRIMQTPVSLSSIHATAKLYPSMRLHSQHADAVRRSGVVERICKAERASDGRDSFRTVQRIAGIL